MFIWNASSLFEGQVYSAPPLDGGAPSCIIEMSPLQKNLQQLRVPYRSKMLLVWHNGLSMFLIVCHIPPQHSHITIPSSVSTQMKKRLVRLAFSSLRLIPVVSTTSTNAATLEISQDWFYLHFTSQLRIFPCG